MAQKPPGQLVAVAAVGRVGEETLLKVGEQRLEEVALRRDSEVRELFPLEFGYQSVLLGGNAVGEGHAVALAGSEIQRRQADPVGLGPLPIRARQSTVHVGESADLGRPGTVLVGGEEALEERSRRPCLVWGQNQQCRCLSRHAPPRVARTARDGAPLACRTRRSAGIRSSGAGIAILRAFSRSVCGSGKLGPKR